MFKFNLNMTAILINIFYKSQKFVLGYDLNRNDSAESLSAVMGYVWTNYICVGYVDLKFGTYFDRSFVEPYNVFFCFQKVNYLAQNNFRVDA